MLASWERGKPLETAGPPETKPHARSRFWKTISCSSFLWRGKLVEDQWPISE
jgi:hypothetical protein